MEPTMTHDARLPSLEEVMNGSPFDIIDSPWGHIERWRASTLATGTMGALKNVYDIVRADAAEAMARADAEEARTTLIKHVCERVDALAARVDAVTSELETIKAKERADAEAAADAEEERLRQLAEDPLEDPPDISEYQARNPPSEIGDDTHQPGGVSRTTCLTPMLVMRVKGHLGWPFGAQAPAPDDCAATSTQQGRGQFLLNQL